MAKILVVVDSIEKSDHWIPQCQYQFISRLLETNHDIIIITSYSDNEEFEFKSNRLEIYRPFTKWRPWEFAHCLKVLNKFDVDIAQFLQPRSGHVWPNFHAFPLLLQGTAAFTSPLKSYAVFSANRTKFKREIENLHDLFDCVFVSQMHLGKLIKEHYSKYASKFTYLECPIFSSSRSDKSFERTSVHLHESVQFFNERIDLNRFFRHFFEFNETCKINFKSGWGNISSWDKQYLQTSWLENGYIDKILINENKNANVHVFFGNPHEDSKVLSALKLSQEGNFVLVSKEYQKLNPYHWISQRNGLVYESTEQALFRALDYVCRLEPKDGLWTEQIENNNNISKLDGLGNLINRKYSEALMNHF